MKKLIQKTVNPKILFVLMNIILAIPSIFYMISPKDRGNYAYTYFLREPQSIFEQILNAVIFLVLFSIIISLYFIITKKSDKLFKNIKQLIIYILVITLIFTIMVSSTPSDIWYYIGAGYIDAKYNENPYYTSVQTVKTYITDNKILNNVTSWQEQTVVYGPVWSLIAKVLCNFTFDNFTIALLIYKLSAIIIHIVNCLLIYKMTNKKKKFVALYGLNPLILFEMITNLHNDLYLVFFILLALYFLLKKKNILLTIFFLACATGIKYVAVLLAPFLVIYYLKDKPVIKRIGYSILYAILFISILAIFYSFYMKDINMFLNVFIQQGKYRDSILFVILMLFKNTKILNITKYIFMAFFAILYIFMVLKCLFAKNIKFNKIMRDYNKIIIAFLFLLITNLWQWYTVWLIPTIFWQKSKNIKMILYIQFVYMLVSTYNFALHTESVRVSMLYWPTALGIIYVFTKIDELINDKKRRGKLCKN